jgi:hypothetical protein
VPQIYAVAAHLHVAFGEVERRDNHVGEPTAGDSSGGAGSVKANGYIPWGAPVVCRLLVVAVVLNPASNASLSQVVRGERQPGPLDDARPWEQCDEDDFDDEEDGGVWLRCD